MTAMRATHLLSRSALAGLLLLLLAACGARQATPAGSHGPQASTKPAAGQPGAGAAPPGNAGAPPGGVVPRPINGGEQPVGGPSQVQPGGNPGQPPPGQPAAGAAPAAFCESARTPQDPELMANWVHVEGKKYNYLVPNKNWQAVETTSGIDISSPTGDAAMSFAYLYGTARPPSLQQAEALYAQMGGLTNVNVLHTSPITNGPDGQSQTIEYTGHWAATGADVHGCFEVTLNSSFVSGFTRQANTSVWNGSMTTLRLIRDYVTLINPNG